MGKFIYVFTLEDKQECIEKGFNFICESKISDKVAYVFENSPIKLMNFSKEKLHNILITDIMYY